MPDTPAPHAPRAAQDQDVTLALLELERRQHAHPDGHDQPPTLFHIYGNDHPAQHPVAWSPIPLAFAHVHPAERLLAFADHMETPEAAYTLLHTTAWHRWLGMALCIETSVHPDEAPPPAGNAAAVQDARVVIAVLADPLAYWAVDRTENEDPAIGIEAERIADDPLTESGVGADMSTVLFALTKATLSTHTFARRCTASGLYRWPELRRHPDDPGHADNT